MENQHKYTVCIHCMTYNHEKYLADALEGFVMQKTNFPFVAVVIDDFSTDGTAEVLRQYEAKYPDIIKAVYLQENYYSQHKSKKPFLEPYDSQSKYIALCEGDDYWTDPYKLQKQVDFLEEHLDYVACLHKTLTQEEMHRDMFFHGEELPEGELFPDDIFPQWTAHINAFLMRKGADERWPIKHLDWMESGDTKLMLQCMHVGKVWALPDTMSVYRMHDGSVMSINRDELIEIGRYTKHLKAFLLNFPQINKDYCYMEIAEYDLKRFRNSDGDKNRWYYLYDAWRWAAPYMIKRSYMNCKHTIKTTIKNLIRKH